MKNKTLQEQFADLLTQYDYLLSEVEFAQIEFDRLMFKTVADFSSIYCKNILNQSKRELRRSFDAIVQFCLDHRDSIRFE